jgi:hypothetical protein
MNNNKLERIINLFREEMMTTQSTEGKPGFSEKSPAQGPTAGYSPSLGKSYAKGGRGSRKRWLDYLKSSNGRRN